MKKKQKLGQSAQIAQYVVEGLSGLSAPVAAALYAEKKGYKSGHTFLFKGQKCRVWLSGHYFAYFKEN